MASLVLGPLLRYVGRTEATVWVEVDRACEVDALGHTAPTFEVRGHHYAVVGLTGLPEGAVLEYTVRLDGDEVWPLPGDGRPPSAIHTREGDDRARLVFGSCRVGAPEREPYTLPPGEHAEGVGTDALWAYSRRLQEGIEAWPDGLLLIGDQVYADEVSPATLEFIRARRDTSQPPGEEIADFEEYTRLYRESWTDPDIRWLLATVPSVMIFDDHDVIDDWNISWQWLRDARSLAWWDARITGAFMSYWIYQHIGNLTAEELADEPMYRIAVAKDGDVGPELEAFARKADHEFAATRWASLRDFGRTRVLVVDSRAARVLEEGRRQMVDDEEWAWIVERSRADVDHLLIASTLPVFMSPGVHHLEAWNEAVCDGVWGRPVAWAGERIRRALDLEHWPAFHRSFVRMIDLLRDVATGGAGERRPPASVSRHRRRRPQRLCGRGVAGAARPGPQPGAPDRLLAVPKSAVAVGAVDGEADEDPARGRLPAGGRAPGRSAHAGGAVALPNRPDLRELDRDRRAGRPPRGGHDLPGRAGRSGGSAPATPLTRALGRPPGDLTRAGPPRLADRSTGAPNSSSQPPNAIVQAANHAQPSARPATTSDVQCRSSITRLHATATAMPTAAAARAARVPALRRRPASSASAAKNAAAVDEWPLGNDGPSVAATGSIAGRARSIAALTAFVASESPIVTTARKTGIIRLGTRTHSTAPTTTAITTTPPVVARVETSSSRRCCSDPP